MFEICGFLHTVVLSLSNFAVFSTWIKQISSVCLFKTNDVNPVWIYQYN